MDKLTAYLRGGQPPALPTFLEDWIEDWRSLAEIVSLLT
ncbi:hypothetical protein SpAn4DRAFT_3007 [Sporomusa ovata]|uniref:Mobile element protein n=1 Tax=Sporomusa ovata TaxID=2378 RepID=A0A0U1KYQ3_9FIRM|nr:hypothetical protein SpAn4DRAFT_3007 [Sporomusa ovata]